MFRKYLFGVLVIAFFLSCKFSAVTEKNNPTETTLSQFLEFKDTETQTFYLPRSSAAIIVKFNNTYTDEVAENTGVIKSSEVNRSVLADEISQNPDYENIIDSRLLGETFVMRMRERNQEALPELNLNRAAGNNNIACDVTEENWKVGDERLLFVSTGLNEKNAEVITRENAVCKAVGEHCYVWYIDNNRDFVTADDFSEEKNVSFKILAEKFDKICQLEESICGSHIFETKTGSYFINPFKKISIVLSDIYGDADNPDRAPRVYGYFSPSDLYKNISGNEGQFIYIDSFLYKTQPDEIYSTMVHEYNHLLNVVQKFVINGTYPATWFTEMLSMVCEDMFQKFLNLSDEDVSKSRLYFFNTNYNYGFYDWNNKSTDYLVSKSYPNAYAFGAYLVRNFGGFDLLREIATNPYVNEEAIDAALKKLGIKKYFSNEQADFDYVFYNQFKVLLNSNSANDYTGYISLQKGVGKETDDLYFSPIKLEKRKYSSKNPLMISSPSYFKKEVLIGAMGFSIHVVGVNLKSITIEPPKNELIQWMLVQQ